MEKKKPPVSYTEAPSIAPHDIEAIMTANKSLDERRRDLMAIRSKLVSDNGYEEQAPLLNEVDHALNHLDVHGPVLGSPIRNVLVMD